MKIYLGIIRWLRNYILYFVGIANLSQDKKTELLFQIPKNRNFCLLFVSKTKVHNLATNKFAFFITISDLLACLSYFLHPNLDCQIFYNLDTIKEFMFGAIIYYFQKNLVIKEYLLKKNSRVNLILKSIT